MINQLKTMIFVLVIVNYTTSYRQLTAAYREDRKLALRENRRILIGANRGDNYRILSNAYRNNRILTTSVKKNESNNEINPKENVKSVSKEEDLTNQNSELKDENLAKSTVDVDENTSVEEEEDIGQIKESKTNSPSQVIDEDKSTPEFTAISSLCAMILAMFL